MNKPVIRTVNGQIIDLVVNVLVLQEGDYFVAYCPSLNLSSYGDTIEDARQGFDEVITEYIQYATENGNLAEDLTKNGWKFMPKMITPPDSVDLNIPAGILRQQFTENRAIAVR